MQLGSSKDRFPCFTRLNPCVAHCSTDSIHWVLTLTGRRVPWLRRGICPLANPYEVWYEYTPSTQCGLSWRTTMCCGFMKLSHYGSHALGEGQKHSGKPFPSATLGGRASRDASHGEAGKPSSSAVLARVRFNTVGIIYRFLTSWSAFVFGPCRNSVVISSDPNKVC
jgi:hypothetical protein